VRADVPSAALRQEFGMAEVESPLGPIDIAPTTLYVGDLEASIRWYESALGLQPVSIGDEIHPHAAYQLGASLIVLEPITAALEPAPLGSENATINILVSRDASEVRRELLRRGVRCSEMADSIHYSAFLIRDLDGNRFHVSQPLSQQAERDVATHSGSQ
jgi:catechol 2,3-dioxygenase-like lactoylglutathione lyase family enzyme